MPDDSEPAFAKLNLALHVRRRRADGYHDLETLFAFTDFGDKLDVAASDRLTLRIAGPFAGAIDDADNLVLRAARALAAYAGVVPRASLTLIKRIPVAAGLGGGSADAAAALRLLDRVWQLHTPVEALLAIAAKLGADVPACLASRTIRGEGRGDVLLPAASAGLTRRPIVLVNPRVAVPTGAVFSGWDGIDRGPLDQATDDTSLTVARNDLQAPALTVAPVIGTVLEALAASARSTVSRMSGSGATCFALFDSALPASAAAAALEATHPQWWTVATRLR